MRQSSKRDFTSSGFTTDHINCGSLQRIADAAELMAKNHRDMQNRIEFLERENQFLWEKNKTKNRQIISLRGIITRLKNQRAKQGADQSNTQQ